MKIIVAVKRVIDYEVEIHVNADGTDVVTSDVPMSMNPFDEVALEEAIRLKESGVASHVLAVSIGNSDSQDVLRTALAMGADDALLLETSTRAEPLMVAKALAHVVTDRQADLLLVGKQAIDNDANQTGQMTAALLNCGQAIFTSHLAIDTESRTLNARRDTDYGTEQLQLALPAVVSAALRLNEPRFASLPQIMKAKKKTIAVQQLAELGLSSQLRLKVLGVRAPDARKPVTMLANAQELAAVIAESAQCQ